MHSSAPAAVVRTAAAGAGGGGAGAAGVTRREAPAPTDRGSCGSERLFVPRQP